MSSMEEGRMAIVEAIGSGEVREDARADSYYNLEVKRLAQDKLQHQDLMELENRRIIENKYSTTGYINALINMGDALTGIGAARRRSIP